MIVRETPPSRGTSARGYPFTPELMMFPYRYICFYPSLIDLFILHTNLYYFYSKDF